MPFSVVLGFASLSASGWSSSFWLIKDRNGLLATDDGVELDAARCDEDSPTGGVASLAESEAAESSVVEPTWNVAGRRKLLGAEVGVVGVEEEADPVPESRDDGRSMLTLI